MTSMIDVVFLLLVFFVWTSSFDKPERNLASQIAMSQSELEEINSQGQATSDTLPDEDAPRSEDVVVRIIEDESGLRYQVGAVDFAAIGDVLPRLQKIAALPTSTVLIVDPDDGVSFDDCIEVFDHAVRFGFPRVLFAVD
nr:biopolymer transporter ExbD [Allorhodopirellula solitaria]